MDARKIIQVGKSSYVVSLPKDWVAKYGFKKGDFIFLERNSNGELVIKPQENSVEEETCLTIKTDRKELKKINRELISAYINNFNKIILLGKDLRKRDQELSSIITNKIGLSIIEKNSDSFVIKDLLDLEATPLNKLVNRMDALVREMFQEIKSGLEEISFPKKSLNELYETDAELNKIYFLVWKISKKCQTKEDLRVHLKLTPNDVLTSQWFAFYFECIGDEIKRIARHLTCLKLKKEPREELTKLINLLEKRFLEVAKAYHNEDRERAIELTEMKDSDIQKIDELIKKADEPYLGVIYEKLKSVRAYIHHLAKLVAY